MLGITIRNFYIYLRFEVANQIPSSKYHETNRRLYCNMLQFYTAGSMFHLLTYNTIDKLEIVIYSTSLAKKKMEMRFHTVLVVTRVS